LAFAVYFGFGSAFVAGKVPAILSSASIFKMVNLISRWSVFFQPGLSKVSSRAI
jgi:hypothetical protein